MAFSNRPVLVTTFHSSTWPELVRTASCVPSWLKARSVGLPASDAPGQGCRAQLVRDGTRQRIDQIDVVCHGDGGQLVGRVHGKLTRVRPGQGVVPGHGAG